MDNKITRKRLSNFLAYDWILLAFICAVAIFIWEMIYSVTSVSLTVGQNYKIYYDYYMLFDTNYLELVENLGGNEDLGYSNGKTFSYEIQKIDVEKIYQESDVLSYRTEVKEGDIFFTDDSLHKLIGKEKTQYLTKLRVDGYDMYIFDNLLADAKGYLSGFLKAEFLDENGNVINKDANPQYDINNFDTQKIKKCFEDRLKDDNRFRTENQKQVGLELETQRLENLTKEVSDFEKIINLPDEYFFVYTKYEQAKEIAISQGYSEELVSDNQAKIDNEIKEGRQNVRYGLRLDKINEVKDTTVGKVDLSKYFFLNPEQADLDENGKAVNNIVAMVFNFKEYQPDLQYESIAVINSIVRDISTILD